MQLLLSYFDQIRGPEVLLAFPQEITENTRNIIANFMQIQIDENFFAFHPSNPQSPQYIYTYRHFISAINARGSQILILLTGIFQINLDPGYIKFHFEQIIDNISKIPEISNFLLTNAPTRDICFHQISQIMTDAFAHFSKKETEFLVINRLFSQTALTPTSPPAVVSKTLARVFISSIDNSIPEGPKILFNVGQTVGYQLSPIIQGTEIGELLFYLSKFWKAQAFGIIDDVKETAEHITFNVYDCFECAHVPNIGRTICKFDEGLLTALLNTKLAQNYQVKELECYGTGYNHCRFLLKQKKSNPNDC